ncbi:glycosyltransferase family 1 protein [Aquibacillus salsiterrae]|uniref:Glycosyltransferase family 1 protein n=1 Tax=Aquibacillus salsiterrae TaxID=2950439 RepID=A0A9X4AG09_9BACI|nr:glycosyltransferase family 1 protein [Aquibacillus salsiterrae]MDC3416603.1 glycosyltransferase family 1 protein [Aquibacillus salsiterrae]
MSKPIRVLQVFAQMNRGGAETMIMNLYRNIDRSRIQFDFIVHTEDECDYDEEIKTLGGTIHRVPRYTGKNHFQYKKAWFDFFRFYPEYKIIHGHVRSTASIYLKVAKNYGLTTIAHSHSTSSGKGVTAITKNILQYPIRYTADYLFACSKSAGEWLYGKGASSKNNFYVLSNAIDAVKYIYDENIRLEKRKEFQIENKLVIGHVGRFSPPKNHTFLIDIFKTVHDKNENAVLLLVGDGEQRSLIETKVNELGLYDNVIFTGIREDIPELLQAIDIFLFPSIYEGLPVTLVEAQASGLPCVISDRITEEVAVTNSIRFISLEEKVEYWAETVLEISSSYKRDNNYLNIVESGYDIKSVTKWYAEFYGSKVKDA